MGKDIHMFIVDNEYNLLTSENIYCGRCRDWFDNLAGEGYDKEYDYLEYESHSWNKEVFEKNEQLKDYTKENYFFDFCTIKISTFVKWFEKYRPDLDAGWISVYDKWAYEKKGIEIEEPRRYPSKEEIENENLVFMEFEKEYDNSRWLYNYIRENSDTFNPEDFIIFCFDY